jgi:hypothetical protein
MRERGVGDLHLELVIQPTLPHHAAGHVDGDELVPRGLIPAAGAEAGDAAHHREAAAPLGDELDGPFELFAGERAAGNVAADHHVVLQQLLARRGEAAEPVVDANQPWTLHVLRVGDHRQALNVLVFRQRVVDPAIFVASGPLHVDDPQLAIGPHEVKRHLVVLQCHFAFLRRQLQLQLAVIGIGFDDELERLRLAGQCDRQRGDRRQLRPIL